MQNIFNKTNLFQVWLDGLKDQRGRARVLVRLDAAEHGNFGDCASVGEGVSEMRIHFGPGYRVYYAQQGKVVYLLLAGGSKSTQSKDIDRAKAIWREVKEQNL